jgi:lambda family phage tail tape measure protein
MDVISLGVEVQTRGAAQSAQQLGQFTSATKGAAGAADTLEDQLRRTATAQTQVASTARPLVGAMQGVGQAFKNNTSAIQNASFQLQDIVVQLEMGVPASRALGQQLPQLLGGFGALGAVTGLAVGLLLSFAPAAFTAADSAETLKDAMDALEDAMQRVKEAQKGQSLADLSKQYGAQAEAAKELLNIQRQIAEIEAERAFNAASVAVAEAMGGKLSEQTFETALNNALLLNKVNSERIELSKIAEQIQRGELQLTGEQSDALVARRLVQEENLQQLLEYRRGLEGITSAFGVSEQAAANLVIQMAAVLEAEDTETRIAASRALAEAINEATDGLKLSAEEGRALSDQLLQAALAGLDLKNLDLPSALSAAASEAARIADEMGRAASNAITMATQSFSARAEAEIRLRFAGDPVGQARALAEQRFSAQNAPLMNAPVGGDFFAQQRETYVENQVAAAEAQLALQKLNETMKGGAASASDLEREAARLYESTRTEAERYAAELAKVEALFAVGAINGEVYSRALEDLNAKFDPFTKLVAGVASSIENELNNAFASVLKGTADLGDALLSFASNVLAKVAQDLFAQQFAGPIASGISAIFSANGNVFDAGGVTAFAKGGVVGGPTVFPFANGIGLMGEAGPEAIMPLSRGADGKLGVIASGGGAPSVTINNYSGQEASASSDSAGNIVIEIGRAIAQDITSGGPSYRAIRSTFGLSNRLQQRG